MFSSHLNIRDGGSSKGRKRCSEMGAPWFSSTTVSLQTAPHPALVRYSGRRSGRRNRPSCITTCTSQSRQKPSLPKRIPTSVMSTSSSGFSQFASNSPSLHWPGPSSSRSASESSQSSINLETPPDSPLLSTRNLVNFSQHDLDFFDQWFGSPSDYSDDYSAVRTAFPEQGFFTKAPLSLALDPPSLPLLPASGYVKSYA
jgi:hypothetical protein